jgi:hypothetical protein
MRQNRAGFLQFKGRSWQQREYRKKDARGTRYAFIAAEKPKPA